LRTSFIAKVEKEETTKGRKMTRTGGRDPSDKKKGDLTFELTREYPRKGHFTSGHRSLP